MRRVAPHETIEIDVKKLRDEQIPDEWGMVIPLNSTKGQFKWSLKRTVQPPPGEEARHILALLGRTEQVDLAKGVTNSYACINWCISSYVSSYLTPTSAEVEVGDTVDFKAYEESMDHYGTYSGYYQRLAVNSYGLTYWSSSQTGVATIASNSTATAVAPGTTTISATWQDYNAPIETICYPERSAFADSKNQFESLPEDTGSSPNFLPEPCEFCAVHSIIPAPYVSLIVKPKVTNVTSDTDTFKITNVLGNSSFIHFVTPKGSGDVTLTATLSGNTTPVLNDISWEGATESSTDPRIATVSRGSASKNIVKIKYKGSTIKELRVWVVWATITAIEKNLHSYRGSIDGASATAVTGGYDFIYTISPGAIFSDTDQPNLSGANESDPPGGSSLAGGVNKKWDGSRQKKTKILNPSSIADSFLSTPAPTTITAFPSNDVEGNDDANLNGENNDPYANGGFLIGEDDPHIGIKDTAGSLNNTYEYRLHFREFARLELNGTWYRVSDFFLWRIHLSFIKNQTQWVNYGSDQAEDNVGF